MCLLDIILDDFIFKSLEIMKLWEPNSAINEALLQNIPGNPLKGESNIQNL